MWRMFPRGKTIISKEGKDFIAFLRKGQLKDVHWAGKPYKDSDGADAVLEPRKSFKVRHHSSHRGRRPSPFLPTLDMV